MRRKQFVQVITTFLMLLPFVIFQGVPALMPEWLHAPSMGVPATVWLVIAGYGGFVVLSWCCLSDENMRQGAR